VSSGVVREEAEAEAEAETEKVSTPAAVAERRYFAEDEGEDERRDEFGRSSSIGRR
jgi:hypothetical protein